MQPLRAPRVDVPTCKYPKTDTTRSSVVKKYSKNAFKLKPRLISHFRPCLLSLNSLRKLALHPLVIQALALDNWLDVYEAALTVSDPVLKEQIRSWIAQRAKLISKKSKEEGIKLRDDLLHLLSPEKPVVESQ